MALYDDTPLDYEAQDQAMIAAQARIKALRAMGAAPVEAPAMSPGWTSSVTGAHIGGKTLRTPTAALLSPILGTVGAELGEGQLVRAKQAQTEQAQQDLQQFIGSNPQGTPAIPGGAPLQGPTPDGSPLVTQPQAAVAPTRQDLLAHAATARGPLAKAVAQKQIEDLMVAAPTREAAQAIAQANTQWDRTFKLTSEQEKARHNKAMEDKTPPGSWMQSNMSANGVPTLINPTTRMMMTADGKQTWSMDGGIPPRGVTLTGTATPAAGGGTSAPPLSPTALPIDAATRKDVVANANRLSDLDNLQSEYNRINPHGITNALANRLPDIGKSGLLGDKYKDSAEYWSNFGEQANAQLRAMSGLAVTEGEAKRQRDTMPGASTDPKLVNNWFERQRALTTMAATRDQALAQNKGATWDPKAGVVRDVAGNPIRGTESPLTGNASAAPAPAPAVPRQVTPTQQSQRDGDAKTVLQSELSKAQQRAQEIVAALADPATKPKDLLDLQAEMSRNAQDIEGLQREIGRLPGSTMPKTQALPRSNPQNQPKTLKWGDLK